MDSDYEVKNGWLLCCVAVVDRKLNDMEIDTASTWQRCAYKIDSITGFRANEDEYKDEELTNTITIAVSEDSYTIDVSFDEMLKIMNLT